MCIRDRHHRAQVVEDAAGGVHGRLRHLQHAVQVGLQGRFGRQLPAQPVQIQLQRGERRAPGVVDVAGDVGAVSYTHLDVYKRQEFLLFLRANATAEAGAEDAGADAAQPQEEAATEAAN